MQELAVFGGPQVIPKPIRDRWRQTHLSDLRPLIRCVKRDQNTEVGGPHTRALENGFRKLVGTRHALAMNSGTATLHSAFFAVGVKPGDEVIVPSYTFFASAAPILQCGGRPVFCDIDPHTLTADPENIEARITPRTKAICVVHVWGNPAPMDRFVELAKKHGLALIEDCSHAHGAKFDGKPVGAWGDIGCFSLQGLKSVSGGEAGIATTNSDTLFDRMLALGHNGRTSSDQKNGTYDIGSMSFGLKYRPHLFAMILAEASLRRLPTLNRLRKTNYDDLAAAIDDEPAVSVIGKHPKAERGGYLEYILHFDSNHAGGWNAGAFAHAVRAEGVPLTVDRYAHLADRFFTLHEAPMFANFDFEEVGGPLSSGKGNGVPEDLPHTMRLPESLLRLPPLSQVDAGVMKDIGKAIRKVANFARQNAKLDIANSNPDVTDQRTDTHSFAR